MPLAEIDSYLTEFSRLAERKRRARRLAKGLAVRLRIDPAADGLVFVLGQGQSSNNLQALQCWVSGRLEVFGEGGWQDALDGLEGELQRLLVEYQ
jgi:hypothetical protein